MLQSLHELSGSSAAIVQDAKIRTWSQGVERAFAEVAVRIRARHSLPDWVTAAGQLLQNVIKNIDTEARVFKLGPNF